jgi:ABC-type transporter lipoprotein component MlaA
VSLKLFDYFQDNSETLDRYPDTLGEIEDPYIFTRNLYLQGLVRDADAAKAKRAEKNAGSDAP